MKYSESNTIYKILERIKGRQKKFMKSNKELKKRWES